MGAAEAIAFAQQQMGKPYVFGATGPDSWDCSGLVQAACHAGGVDISRTTYTQIFDGVEVAQNKLQPGDLIFPDPGHVQLYVGNNMVIEAPHSGAFVQMVSVWGFWRARRVFTGAPADPGTDATVGLNTNPANVITDITKLPELISLTGNLVNPTWWHRIGLGMMGAFIIALALYWLNHERVNHAIGTVAKVAAVVPK